MSSTISYPALQVKNDYIRITKHKKRQNYEIDIKSKQMKPT